MSTDEILSLTNELLETIQRGDWENYARLCSPDMTCFEPEARGQQVHGLEFHRYYFEQGGHMGKHANTICAPAVRPLGADAALISYVRLVQKGSETDSFEETRIWQRTSEGWKCVHFHRSRPISAS